MTDKTEVDDGGMVYPERVTEVGGGTVFSNGITRRDQLADMLLVADYQEFCRTIYDLHLKDTPFLELQEIAKSGLEIFKKDCPKIAYEITDAMIAEGKK